MRIITLTLLAAILLPVAPLMAQSADALEPDAKACASGTSALTRTQCAFIQQTAEAMRKANQVVASGEFAKLPKASQEAMVALINALIAGIPVMKSK
jgi:hypothetical protein